MRTLLASCLLVTALAVVPRTAIAQEVAPGRVLFPVADGGPSLTAEGSIAQIAAVLDDDSSVLVTTSPADRAGFGVQLLGPTGVPGAVRRVDVGVPFTYAQALRLADGRLLVTGSLEPTPTFPVGGERAVLRLGADGTLDRAYGTDGIARTGVGAGCGACTAAALLPDGSIALAGDAAFRWTVSRLTPAGTPDTGFGDGGLAQVTTQATSGFSLAALPNGSLLTTGQLPSAGGASATLIARLTPTGTLDSAYHGGTPLTLPSRSGFAFAARADGSAVVSDSPGPVVGVTAGGELDRSFGKDGVALLPATGPIRQLLPQPDGSTLAFTARAVVGNAYSLIRITRDGTMGIPMSLDAGFAGGASSYLALRPPSMPPLRGTTFTGAGIAQRADGGFLVAGGVSLVQPLAEGESRSIARGAVAAFTGDGKRDPRFGGVQAPLLVGIRGPAQRARTAVERGAVRVLIRTSAPALARVRVRARGRVIAQAVVPLFRSGAQTLPIALTPDGVKLLRRTRGLTATITARARDLLGTTTETTGRARLR